MAEFKHSEIEKKWQQRWAETGAFAAETGASDKEKFYCLVEFPYPSGNGLHVGHPRPYTAIDIIARMKRMQGYNVMFPMGFDAFGLPTENFAIKHKIHPAEVTKQNTQRFKEQLLMFGFSIDWSRLICTTDPQYYKWTQWIFLKMFEHGLAYKKEMNVNWCTSCLCVLANEEVVDGSCERCGAEVIRKLKSQWNLRITAYAEKLLAGLDDLDYIPQVKQQQRNWIGKSVGAEVDFKTVAADGSEQEKITVFTTRPDTLYGVSYVVLAPEHPLLKNWLKSGIITNADAVADYQREAAKKSDFERAELAKNKTGVCLQGVEAVNPVNGNKIPIYTSDYVLVTYGTGAVMAVPAHDSRDFEFAVKFGLPVVQVIAPDSGEVELPFTTYDGHLINSELINGLSIAEAKSKITEWLSAQGSGREQVNYKLRDWVFSRQRYWGEPIPIVECPKCSYVALPEEQLPLELPDVSSYEPTDNGESPLANLPEWVNTVCPRCGGPAKRETDTMPQWAGSSWYFLRYCDPDNDKEFASQEALRYWLGVDWYNGGMEHTTLHLLYSRFWHLFLYDIGLVPTAEPYVKRTSHGMILGQDGEKMSKSRGNVITPDSIIEELGADTLRVYEMFIGDFEKVAPWNDRGLRGCRRFLERVHNLPSLLSVGSDSQCRLDDCYSKELETLLHQTVKKVGHDILHLKFNTAIAQLMTLTNAFYDKGTILPCELKTFLKLLAPFAPHLAEEMWESQAYGDGFISLAKWPEYSEEKCVESTVEIAIQVNGKLRGTVKVAQDTEKDEVFALAKVVDTVLKHLENKEIVKEIYVPKRLVNFVIR